MSEILNQLNTYLKNPILETDMTLTVAVIGTILIGIVYCFLGYRAVRVIAAILGILIGAAVGNYAVTRLNLTNPAGLAITAACAIAFALLSYFLFRVGVFVAVLIAIWGVTNSILTQYTSIDRVFTFIIALVIGVIFAILSVIYLRPMIIVVTALGGGMMFTDLIFEHLIHIRWSFQMETIIRIAVGLLFAIIGMVYQFASTRRD